MSVLKKYSKKLTECYFVMVGVYVCMKNFMGQEPVVVHQIVISRIFMVSLILALFSTLKDKNKS